ALAGTVGPPDRDPFAPLQREREAAEQGARSAFGRDPDLPGPQHSRPPGSRARASADSVPGSRKAGHARGYRSSIAIRARSPRTVPGRERGFRDLAERPARSFRRPANRLELGNRALGSVGERGDLEGDAPEGSLH